MTYLEMEMKEFVRSSGNNTHNISSLIRTPQVCHRRLPVGRSLHGGRVWIHTHTHTHTHTRTHTHKQTHTHTHTHTQT